MITSRTDCKPYLRVWATFRSLSIHKLHLIISRSVVRSEDPHATKLPGSDRIVGWQGLLARLRPCRLGLLMADDGARLPSSALPTEPGCPARCCHSAGPLGPGCRCHWACSPQPGAAPRWQAGTELATTHSDGKRGRNPPAPAVAGRDTACLLLRQ